MNEKSMSKKPVIVSDDGIKQLQRTPLSSKTFKELWLQELLEKSPETLPTGYVDNIFAPLIFVAREVEVESGYIDNLYISAKGYIVIVETKLWRNPESKRQVVGQILDYAKDVSTWNYEKLDSVYKEYNKGKTLFSQMIEKGFYEAEDESYFIDVVEKNIQTSRFLLMVVGDGIREDVEKMAEFLNSSVSMQFQFALCELEVYELKDGERLIVPQLTTKTKVITRTLVNSVSQSETPIKLPEEPSKSKSSRKEVIASLEEWVENISAKNSKINPDEIISFVNDMTEIGYQYHLGTAELILVLVSEKLNTKLTRIWINSKHLYFQPAYIYNDLRKSGYSEILADGLFEKLRPFLSKNQKNVPYEYKEGFYGIDLKTITSYKAEILEIFEQYKLNF